METFPPTKQRSKLLEFATALGSADRALRPDECGDPRINGNRGHIYAVPGGFQIYISRAWTNAKDALAFAKVTLDCDGEGLMHLHRLPTSDEAAALRYQVGIPKRREVSAEESARLRAIGAAHRYKAAA